MSVDQPANSTARGGRVNDPPYRTDPTQGARVANIRSRLELEHRARDSFVDEPRDLARRLGQLEARLAGLVRLLGRAGLVEVDLLGAVTAWTGSGSLLDRLDDVEHLAAHAFERADAG